MKLVLSSVVVCSFMFSSVLLAQSQGSSLFKYSGKVYNNAELSTRSKLEIFDVESEHFKRLEVLLENEILDLYFKEEAAKQKKTVDEVAAKAMEVKEPSDKEMKRFFESNKSRMPVSYTYDQIKPQIAMVLKQEKQYEKRAALLAKVKKSKSVEIMLKAPVAPKVTMNVAGFPTAGNAKAKIQLVEFADYTCVHCKTLSTVLDSVIKKFKNKIEVVFVPFVLNDNGPSAAVFGGTYCAMKQNKFLEYNKMAFEKQNLLSKDSATQFAKDLKLNQEEFKKCLETPDSKDFYKKGTKLATDIGLGGTPTLFINGIKYNGGHSVDDLSKAINSL